MSNSKALTKKDYMDIDEFLSSQNLCESLSQLAESDVGDLVDFSVPIDFALSPEQLHEYTANEIDIDGPLQPVASPISSDDGQGKSICSETGTSECSSVFDKSIELPRARTRSKRSKKSKRSKRSKSLTSDSGDGDRSDSSKARTSTWKSSTSTNKQCLATSVEIEGVPYTYNLMPTSKGRKPSRKSVPGSMKDGRYWDRRSKNNEAAKRSRDLRRRKEMLVASKAADLEIENEELKAEVIFLKERVKMLNTKLHEKKF